MQIEYFGWSGIALEHTNTFVGFDLFGDAVTSEVLNRAKTIIICLTHGHPEHAGSLREFLAATDVRPYVSKIHLISSSEVIRYVNRHNVLAQENTHPISNAETVTIHGITITAFEWVHMPLLPPGLPEKLEYIFQLLLHPLDLIRIGTLGLRLPMNAPQLGFHITYPDGTRVLNYSEGVHRLTDPEEVEQVAARLPADLLFFAVEPDDRDAIPRWVEILAVHDVCIYEAHRPWRDLFHLPYIDIDEYARHLSERFHEKTFSGLTTVGQVITKEKTRGDFPTTNSGNNTM